MKTVIPDAMHTVSIRFKPCHDIKAVTPDGMHAIGFKPSNDANDKKTVIPDGMHTIGFNQQ